MLLANDYWDLYPYRRYEQRSEINALRLKKRRVGWVFFLGWTNS
jgi:hypothetical protein